MPDPATEAVLFDYGLTLVGFEFPRACLLQMLERFRPALAAATGGEAPAAAALLRDVLEALEDGLGELGEDEVADYLAFYGACWERAGLRLPRDLLEEILDAEQLCWDRSVFPAPGALELLAQLRARGVRTAICSNAPFPAGLMRRQLAGNGIGPLVDAVVFSSEVGRRKPAPEPYRAALAAVDVGPEAALHVGDRFREDYEGPRALGIRAVLCTALAREPPPPGTPVIAALPKLLQLL